MAFSLGTTSSTAFRTDSWISRINFNNADTPFSSNSPSLNQDIMVKSADGCFGTGFNLASSFAVWISKFNLNGELEWVYYYDDDAQFGFRPLEDIQETSNGSGEFVAQLTLNIDGENRPVLVFGNLESGPNNNARAFTYNGSGGFAGNVTRVANQPNNRIVVFIRPDDPSIDTTSTFVDYMFEYEVGFGIRNLGTWDDKCGNIKEVVGTKDYVYYWSNANSLSTDIPGITSTSQQVICTQVDPTNSFAIVNRIVVANAQSNDFETLMDYAVHDPNSDTFVCSFLTFNSSQNRNNIYLQEFQNVDSSSALTETGFEVNIYPTAGSTSDSETYFRTFSMAKLNSNIYLSFNYWGLNLTSTENQTFFLMRISNTFSNFRVFKFVISGSPISSRGMQIVDNKLVFLASNNRKHYTFAIPTDMPTSLYGTTYSFGDRTITISDGSSDVDYNQQPNYMSIVSTETSGFPQNFPSGFFVEDLESLNWQQYNVAADTDYIVE